MQDQLLRMAVFYAAHEVARRRRLELRPALEFATDCALAGFERLLHLATQLVTELRSCGT